MTSAPLHSTEKLETNQENSFAVLQSVPYTDLSKTTKLLENLIGIDLFVHEFSKSL